MQAAALTIPDAPRLVLAGARVPAELVADPPAQAMRDAEGALLLDVLVDHGKVAGLFPAGHAPDTAPRVALQGRHLWPAFIDMHTHLDCGHAIPASAPTAPSTAAFP